MTAETDTLRPAALERLLAEGLTYGTWLASATIALGLAGTLVGWPAHTGTPASSFDMRVVATGVALFILMPVCRVALMLAVFVRTRDYRFAAIAALVLAIIALGFVLGAVSKVHGAG